MIVSAISQGMLWAILGLGIFMTYRILDFPDMTTEGSFPLGAAVCVTAITHGVAPIVATLLGVGAGMIAGLVTGLLYTKGKIPVILAGILVMSGLNSVILFVMRTPNLSLLNHPILQDSFHRFGLPDYFDTVLLGFISLGILIAVLLFFFNTDLGQGLYCDRRQRNDGSVVRDKNRSYENFRFNFVERCHCIIRCADCPERRICRCK